MDLNSTPNILKKFGESFENSQMKKKTNFCNLSLVPQNPLSLALNTWPLNLLFTLFTLMTTKKTLIPQQAPAQICSDCQSIKINQKLANS